MGITTATSTTLSPTALQARARRLRRQAAPTPGRSVHPLLAEAYRRRAAELDLQAWLEAVWNPPLDPEAGPPRRCDPRAA